MIKPDIFIHNKNVLHSPPTLGDYPKALSTACNQGAQIWLSKNKKMAPWSREISLQRYRPQVPITRLAVGCPCTQCQIFTDNFKSLSILGLGELLCIGTYGQLLKNQFKTRRHFENVIQRRYEFFDVTWKLGATWLDLLNSPNEIASKKSAPETVIFCQRISRLGRDAFSDIGCLSQ